MLRSVLGKRLPWLSIRSKLIIAFVGLSIVPLVLIGINGISSNVQLMEKIVLEDLTHDVLTVRENTANFLSNIEGDVRVLRHSYLLEEFVEREGKLPKPEKAALLRQLQSEILAFAQTKGIYYQIRIVGNEGDELLRVRASAATDTGLMFRVEGSDELREGRETFYFLLVKHLLADQVAFSASEIADAEHRPVPVISFAMPLIGSNHRVGILVADVFAKNLFRVIEEKRHLDTKGKIVLVNGEGHYLYHSEKEKDWNGLLASRQEDNLQHDYPPALVTAILSGGAGTLSEGVDEIISYGPLFPSAGGDKITPGFAMPCFVFESVPKDVVLGQARSSAWTFAGFLAIFLVVAVGLGLLATRQFTKPIAQLHHGAEIISEGNYSHRLEVESHDEIEELAEQFNSMAASLESHEAEIQQHRTKLEEMVHQRTRELSDETTKLQAILDHVPSAIVLLDRHLRVLSASAAFSSIVGCSFEQVKGKECREVFLETGFCKDCACRRAVATGAIEVQVHQTNDHARGERFFEHVAIPMIENGEVGAVLEIITDVTERKRLEKNLLQAERLTTAGEISAIIAHEFRNSLTSIKMILQLQRESRNLNRSEKKSLLVALNSIEQMEHVVSELLNFARPKPIEFRAKSLNSIIESSVMFAQPQISKQRMRVTQMLDPELPLLLLDEPLIKEAVINVLLNAAHAGTQGDQAPNHGEIRVVTRRERLRKALKDHGVTERAAAENGGERLDGEIVLHKGTECALVLISDDGCGIDRNNLSRIFDPFFTTKTNGTGLGLPMVKRTVNAHGGIVAVTSTLRKGTTVKFYLPFNNHA